MKMNKALLATVAVLMPVFAQSADGPYIGADIAQITDKSNGSSAAEVMAISLKVGKKFNENVALEARYLFGIDSAQVDLGGGNFVEYEAETGASLLAKGILPISEQASVYGLIGYTKATGTYNDPIFGTFSDTDEGSSYGIGFSYATPDSVALNVEWMSYLDKDWGKVTGFSVGLSTTFK